MAVRSPLFLSDASGTNQIAEGDSTYMTALHEFAGYAFAQDPNPSLEVQGSNGSVISGQPFVDTFYVAGAYSTRVDRFATEAETADIVLTTENYSRIRQVTDAVSAPSGDANNHEYPLYLYNPDGEEGEDINTHLRAMTISDFYDTFVAPVLTQFGGGGQTAAKGGTYFITTSASPANASLVSTTPIAINKVSDTAAYTASGIPEAVEQTIDTNYYLAKVDYPAASYPEIYDQLPIYWDFANNRINAHTPGSWSTLMNKFLRYYLSSNSAGQYQLSYNVDGSDGVLNGALYIDERRTPDGSAGGGGNYQQLYVNTNDYRTQEFPTGTTTVVQSQSFKIYQGIPSAAETTSLEGTQSVPETTEHVNGYAQKDTNNITLGWRFNSDATVEDRDSTRTPEYSANNHADWVNSGPTQTWYIRATIDSNSGLTTSGDSLNTWLTLDNTTSRSWNITDTANPPVYNTKFHRWKIEIATDSGGSNIVSTGYYHNQLEGDNIRLEGTQGTPKTNPAEQTHGTKHGFRLATGVNISGKVEHGNDYGGGTSWSATTMQNWSDYRNSATNSDINFSNYFAGTYYVRGTVDSGTSTGTITQQGDAMNTWHILQPGATAANSVEFLFADSRTLTSYGTGQYLTYKIEIASDAAGSNIIDTGYYKFQYAGTA